MTTTKLTKTDKAITIIAQLYNESEQRIQSDYPDSFYMRKARALARMRMEGLNDLYEQALAARESMRQGERASNDKIAEAQEQALRENRLRGRYGQDKEEQDA